MKVFTLKQEATCLPETFVKHLAKGVTSFPMIILPSRRIEDVVLVQLEDFWVRINLTNHTYAIGAYEG